VGKRQLAAIAQKVQKLGILQGAQMCVTVAAAEYHRQGFLARAISVKPPLLAESCDCKLKCA